MSDELLDVAHEAARRAAALLRERFSSRGSLEISSKSTPTDLVSEADLAAEEAIRAVLAERRPGDELLGEEGGGEVTPLEGDALRWVFDPLDGTINFLYGIPQWCVSVACQDAEGSVVGVILDPNREEEFVAVRGRPATLNGVPLEPRAPTDLAGAMVVTGYAYDAAVRDPQAEIIRRLVPLARDVRRFGSAALDLAWLAAGRSDAYFERTVKPWDIAAGTLLCESVGLEVRELPARDGLPWGIAVARSELLDELLELGL